MINIQSLMDTEEEPCVGAGYLWQLEVLLPDNLNQVVVLEAIFSSGSMFVYSIAM